MNRLVTDEELVAFLHGELGEEASASIEAVLLADPELAQRAERMAEQDEQIRLAFAPILEEEVPERLSAIVTAKSAEADVIDFATAKAKRGRAGWGLPQLGAMAASLVLGLFIGQSLIDGSSNTAEEALLVATQGGLRVNPEVQEVLSKSPSGRAVSVAGLGKVDVAITFAANDGRLCRQFALEGSTRTDDAVACRDGGEWKLEALGLRPEASGEMRTAGGDVSPAVVSTVDGMIAGEPLLGAAEASALRN